MGPLVTFANWMLFVAAFLAIAVALVAVYDHGRKS
jgi:hypothetical protein